MGVKPNRLIDEQSPYLLQHAYNPVEWYPWGEEAFAKARAEDKPVFLSIGYSTCHWCHVMAHESFENTEIAEILNRWFVSVKVDREERPDIDQMYMTVTQAMTGSGGWPMSVFLTPDGSPFYAGTYFPPQGKYGMPGFADVLNSLHNAWENRRGDVEEAAGQMIKNLQKFEEKIETSTINPEINKEAFRIFEDEYDRKNGGFGTAPKFPRPVVLNFLFQYWQREKNERAKDMVITTLVRMARGGMYDHLGGGFHRYSTDQQWREPHFEKMLYDQSQLADIYLDAFLITGDRMFADIAEDILRYVLRDMTAAEGGFYSAEDADSEDPYNPGEKSEGAYYLWTMEEVDRLLKGKNADIFSYCYGLEVGGNAPEDPQGEFKGKNILYIAHSVEEAASRFDLPEEEIRKRLQQSKKLLFEQRTKRKKPHLDDKIITAWNGLMIAAFARGGLILEQPELLAAAEKAAFFIKNELFSSDENRLARRYRKGISGLAGQLDDYAFLVYGLNELYQATQNPDWLEWAVELNEQMISLFWDNKRKGFYDSVGDASLPVRMRGHHDGAEPSGNTIAVLNLIRIGQLTGNDDLRIRAEQTLASFSGIMNGHPDALPLMLTARDLLQGKPRQVVISGIAGREDTRQMLHAAGNFYDPGAIVLLADGAGNQKVIEKYLPFIEFMGMVDNKATAYVCQNYTCRQPVNDLASLLELLNKGVGR